MLFAAITSSLAPFLAVIESAENCLTVLRVLHPCLPQRKILRNLAQRKHANEKVTVLAIVYLPNLVILTLEQINQRAKQRSGFGFPHSTAPEARHAVCQSRPASAINLKCESQRLPFPGLVLFQSGFRFLSYGCLFIDLPPSPPAPPAPPAPSPSFGATPPTRLFRARPLKYQ